MSLENHVLDLPKPLRWADRAASMPYITGGGDAQLESLRALLLRVVDDGGEAETVRAVDYSRPTGFVERAGRGRWQVTEAARAWLDTGDDAFLIGVLHSRIRFLGELLEQLDAGQLTHSQLMDIARAEYDLDWSSADQVRRRTTWLRVAGFVELRFDNYLAITPSGRDLLGRLENYPPKSMRGEASAAAPDRAPVELPAGAPEIAQFIASLTPERLRQRRRLIGYLPGGASSFTVLAELVAAARHQISAEDWAGLCAGRLGLGETSALQALGSLRGAGLVQRVARDVDAATPLAVAWLDSGSDLDLIRLLHGHIRFVGEILAFFDTTGSSAELASRALEFQVPLPDLQRRLGLLLGAGLIEEAGVRMFRLTATGQALLKELPLEELAEPAVATLSEETDPEPGVERLQAELRTAARAASDHTRLERAVAAALASIGFTVERLGGPGRTDVRAVAPLPGSNRYVLIADAKASARGQVAPFDVVTLKEHREQHGADHVVAVGECFADRRTIDRACSEGVGLLPIGVLCDLVQLAHDGAVGSADIRAVMAQTGLIDGAPLRRSATAARRELRIAQSVLSILAAEAVLDDDWTKGFLTPSEIYRELRGQTDPPTRADIQAALDLLGNPLIRAVAEVPGRDQVSYVLVEHVQVVAGRLRHLTDLLASTAVNLPDRA